MISLEVNGKKYEVEASSDVPLLWVLREHLGLTGTKYGCGKSLCGACTVHINGKAERSCQIPVRDALGKRITTIEGIPEDHPVEKSLERRGCAASAGCCATRTRSWMPQRSLRRIPIHGMLTLTPLCLATSVAAGPDQRIRPAIHLAAEMMAEGIETGQAVG